MADAWRRSKERRYSGTRRSSILADSRANLLRRVRGLCGRGRVKSDADSCPLLPLQPCGRSCNSSHSPQRAWVGTKNTRDKVSGVYVTGNTNKRAYNSSDGTLRCRVTSSPFAKRGTAAAVVVQELTRHLRQLTDKKHGQVDGFHRLPSRRLYPNKQTLSLVSLHRNKQTR